MKIKLLFFGSFAEKADCEELEVGDIHDLEHLKNWLEEAYKIDISAVKFAVNQELANENVSLKAGDEVAVMPPFAGG